VTTKTSLGSGKVTLHFEHEGRVARLQLAAPKPNVLDAAMVGGLEEACALVEGRRGLRAIVLGAEGPHFSFGASIEEHLPPAIGGALARLHGLIRRLHGLPAPTLALVQGRCLGGGLELVLACDLVLAARDAELGCPEIKLGVFAPAASSLLPLRIGAGRAARLLLTGETWRGEEAAASGLVDHVALPDALEETLQAWLADDFLPRSPAGLRHAARAARRTRLGALETELPVLEKAYLEELMAEADAVEGIRAFLDKRQPNWREEVS
jgi:cyclohexa-1,5-dienecarbonyl-CoA hydratase